MTDRLWEISDFVQVLEDWEAQLENEPSFDVDIHAVDGRPFVRVTFPNGQTEPIYGFATKAAAIKWIRCEAVVWLWQRRERLKLKGVAN